MIEIRAGLCLIAMAANAPFSAHAQQAPDVPAPINDRSAYLPPSVNTSDDVLRVPQPDGYNAPKTVFVLKGARLFDGTGAPARAATIVIQGKKIAAVLKPGDQGWPADAIVKDVSGATVMPGLIDLHTHLTYAERFDADMPRLQASGGDAVLRGMWRMGIYLQSGITSVRDVGSNGDAPFLLKKWQAAGRISGPRIFAAGQVITATGGHGAILALAGNNPMSTVNLPSGPDQWREAVRLQFSQGADLVKLASEYSQAEISAAVDEAHAEGLPVTVDAETRYIDMAIKAGVDSIEHVMPRTDAAIALMAKRGIAAVPTLIPYRILVNRRGGYFGSTSRRFEVGERPAFDMLVKLKKAGVKLGVGTDLIADWVQYMPNAYIEELKYLVRAGYTNSEALTAATKTNSEILRMSDRIGTIEAGKLADIIVVDGEPDNDLDALRNVRSAFVNGRLMIDGGKLDIPVHTPQPLPTRQ